MLFLAYTTLAVVISLLLLCGVIGFLTFWDWMEHQINEEIRIIDMQDDEDKNNVHRS